MSKNTDIQKQLQKEKRSIKKEQAYTSNLNPLVWESILWDSGLITN